MNTAQMREKMMKIDVALESLQPIGKVSNSSSSSSGWTASACESLASMWGGCLGLKRAWIINFPGILLIPSRGESIKQSSGSNPFVAILGHAQILRTQYPKFENSDVFLPQMIGGWLKITAEMSGLIEHVVASLKTHSEWLSCDKHKLVVPNWVGASDLRRPGESHLRA
ncbi:hypothetical protein CR513_52271, partial [Mucuna pruriens]